MFAERAFYCFNVPESEFAPAAYTSISCQSGKTLQKKIKNFTAIPAARPGL